MGKKKAIKSAKTKITRYALYFLQSSAIAVKLVYSCERKLQYSLILLSFRH